MRSIGSASDSHTTACTWCQSEHGVCAATGFAEFSSPAHQMLPLLFEGPLHELHKLSLGHAH
eukprot:4464357-Pleurochrysis_carterae.AAC.1